MKSLSNPLMFALQENETLPLPKVEGDDHAQARALATLYSHPVVSVQLLSHSFVPLFIILIQKNSELGITASEADKNKIPVKCGYDIRIRCAKWL